MLDQPRRLAFKSPLLLPAFCVLIAIPAAEGSLLAGISLLILLASTVLLQGIRGGIMALSLALLIGGLHFHRISTQTQWTEKLSSHDLITFQGSLIRHNSRSLFVEGLPAPSPSNSSPALLEIKLPYKHPPLVLGREYRFSLKQQPPAPPPNPGEFDSAQWKYRMGISGSWELIHFQETGKGNIRSRILALSDTWTNYLLNRFNKGFPADSTGGEVTKSLVLGAKKEASPQTIDAFRLSGLLHIFAVSGLHVAIIALLFTPILFFLKVRPIPFAVIMGVLLLLYDFSTGLSISANRATLMILLYMGAFACFRQSHPANRLAFTAIALLAWDSRCIFQLSFQLSFAVFAIVVMAVHSAHYLYSFFSIDPFIPPGFYTLKERVLSRLSKGVITTLWVSACSWVTASLILYPHIHYITPYSPVANTLLSPLVPLVMAGGLLCLILGEIPFLGSILFSVTRTLAALLFYGAELAADLPGSTFSLAPPPSPGQLRIYSTYGENYAAVMGHPSILIESGSEASARNIIFPSLKKEGYSPKLLAISHFHKNQAEGMKFLHKREQFQYIIAPPPLAPGSSKYPLPATNMPPVQVNDKFDNGNGGVLTILDNPTGENMFSKSADDTTLILLWEYKNHRVLFLSDAGYNAEQRLKERFPELRADIIIIGESRSDLPVSKEYLHSLQPRLIVHGKKTHPGFFDKDSNTRPVYSLPLSGSLSINLDNTLEL